MKTKIIVFCILFFLVLAIASFYLYFTKAPIATPHGAFQEPYRIVQEKISQSAPIKIFLPAQVSAAYAQANIEISPKIDGAWIATEEKSKVLFKPKEKLLSKRFYSIALAMPQGGKMRADFEAVEDPKVVAVFPKEESEAPEDSEITIIFNRPMVPLTTLGILEQNYIPIEITPKTQGRFKWITTKNLQFIPKERLKRSSRYTVRIEKGLFSMDGLVVAPKTFAFTTRHLRYVNITENTIMYSSPIQIRFNQPVDIEKIQKYISLKKINGRASEIPFIAEYQKYEPEKSKEIDKKEFLERSQSVVEIYNKADKFGRKKMWDFNSNYTLEISRSLPLEGDIVLDEKRATSVSVDDPIDAIGANSEKTEYADLNFVDPKGKVWATFYEEIDISRSKIRVPHFLAMHYGEKCKDESLGMYYGYSDCEKTEDKKKIFITFKSDEVGFGEKMDLVFEKIVNREGLIVNRDPITYELVSYPAFQITRTTPEKNSSGANLTEIIVCSNSPIYQPLQEERKDFISGSPEYELGYWENSWRVSDPKYSHCRVGEFSTTIHYGLMPKTDYSFIFRLKDVFGQKADYAMNFTSGPMPNNQLEFNQMQPVYNVTSPDKTKLVFSEKNMGSLDMEICKLDPEDFLFYFENKPSEFSPASAVENCIEIVRDTIDLPKRFWLNNYFMVDLKDYFKDPIGNYIVTFSNPHYTRIFWEYTKKEQEERQVYERSYLTVTRLGVSEKRINLMDKNWNGKLEWEGGRVLVPQEVSKLSNIYWVTNLTTLESVPRAQVKLYKKEGKKFEFDYSYFTDDKGIAFAPVIYEQKAVIVKKGEDSTILPTYESKMNWANNAYSEYRLYMYTDKPLYRPLQEVAIKGVYRIGYDGNYQILEGKEVQLKIINSKGDEVKVEKLLVSEFGTFNASYTIEKNAPLGSYRACAFDYDCAYFEVLEYVPAAFKLEMKPDKEEYISKDIANIDVQADYYFGVPLSGGEVEYTFSSQNYYFDRYSDGEFGFESDSYYRYPYYYQDRFIKRSKTVLSKDGKAKISELINFEKWFKNKDERKSKIIVLDVTVKNDFGQSVSGQKSFLVHAGEFYFNVNSDKYFMGKNEKFTMKIKSVDTKGSPKAVKNVKLDIHSVDWVYAKRQEASGGYQYTWEKQKKLVQSIAFETDSNGMFSNEFILAEEGEYEAEVSSADLRGNLVWEVLNFYVYGQGEVVIAPRNDTGLELVSDKTSLDVGDLAEIIIKSPYPKAKALISIERGEVYEHKILDIAGNISPYSFTIQEKYIPNVFVSVLLVSPKPEVRYGQMEFKVNTNREKITINVSSDKAFYLPGEKVNLDILTQDYAANPLISELSLAVVDLSVLALKGNPKKDPVMFFYGGFPLTVSTASNVKNILVEAAIPKTKGGGGASGSALAQKDELASKKRGDFRETAYWQARLVTDEKGRAKATFTLPDNLTTWQAETLGVTRDTELGVNYLEFTTKKKIMAVPLKPRFVVPGDEFYIGAEVFNQSETKQDVTVSIVSSTLTLKDDAVKKISLNTNENKSVYFSVKAPVAMEDGRHIFIISAKGQGVEDTVEQTINITRNDTYEAVATADYGQEARVKEYVFLPETIVKDKGGLKIQASATLSVFLSDALNYMLEYPYGCTEQISSKLNAIAIVKRGLNLPNIGEKFHLKKIEYNEKEYTVDELVEIGLSEIYSNQNQDGGFALWRENRQSSFYATLDAVSAMDNLMRAGYQVKKDSLKRAAEYLVNTAHSDRYISSSKDNVILAAYALYSLKDFPGNTLLRQRINDIASDDLYIKENISNSALAYLDMVLYKENSGALEKKIFDTLDNRVNIDSRGAFLEANNNFLWYYYETPVKDTALYLKSLVAKKSVNPIIDKVLRWILNSRKKDGAWGSTSNTLAAIDALVDYMEWKKENESNFVLNISLDEKNIGSIQFGAENILEQYVREVPISDIPLKRNVGVEFFKENKNNQPNNFYYDMSLKYYLPQDQIPPRDEGFSIVREYYALDDTKNTKPISFAKTGDVIRAHLQITVPETRNFVNIEDFIPAGFEIVNLDLATEQKSLRLQEKELSGREFLPDVKEIRDDRLFLYRETVYPGVYEHDYFIRALVKGRYTHLPAVVSEMYFPENFGRTKGEYFEIR